MTGEFRFTGVQTTVSGERFSFSQGIDESPPPLLLKSRPVTKTCPYPVLGYVRPSGSCTGETICWNAALPANEELTVESDPPRSPVGPLLDRCSLLLLLATISGAPSLSINATASTSLRPSRARFSSQMAGSVCDKIPDRVLQVD